MLTAYSINKAVNEKKLIATKIGKTRYYKRKDIDNFIDSHKSNAFKYRNY